MKAVVITASNRASSGVYEDRSGPLIVSWLADRGFAVSSPVVVPDGDPVKEALSEAVASGADLVVLDYEIPGLADAIRMSGWPRVPGSVLSRGVAGVAGRTLIVNLPGSTGGVRDGLDVLATVVEHALDQLRGGDHK